MSFVLRQIALFVSDLQDAEALYQQIFDMKVITREAQLEADTWYQVPHGKDWQAMEAAGIQIDMLALQRDDFVLALFRGDPTGRDLFEIGIGMPIDEMKAVLRRLPVGTERLNDELAPDDILFRDPYGFKWHLYEIDEPFQGGGDTVGRWLEI